MKVARYYAPGDVRIEETPEPAPGPREVKLRVMACSTCGTDAKIYAHGHHRLQPPRVLGHEVAGEVVDVGADAASWTSGDRVQMIAAIPCGVCDECRRGWPTVCPNQKAIGYHFDGGFAEHLIVPEDVLRVDGLNRIPDGVSYAEASVAEPFACAINAQELARVDDGDTVVVVGAGPIGCLHVRLARARGAGAVYLVELSRQRLDLAAERVQPDGAVCSAETDAVDAVRKLTDGRGVDVVITAASSGRAQEEALEMAALRGRISLFGGLPKDNPDHRLRLQPGALPRAHRRRGQRVEPGPQPSGHRPHRVRRGTGRRPHHPPPPAPPGPRRHRRGHARRDHQGHHRPLTPSQCWVVIPPMGAITTRSSTGRVGIGRPPRRRRTLWAVVGANAVVPNGMEVPSGMIRNGAAEYVKRCHRYRAELRRMV